jgi:hypothetical protein
MMQVHSIKVSSLWRGREDQLKSKWEQASARATSTSSSIGTPQHTPRPHQHTLMRTQVVSTVYALAAHGDAQGITRTLLPASHLHPPPPIPRPPTRTVLP